MVGFSIPTKDPWNNKNKLKFAVGDIFSGVNPGVLGGFRVPYSLQ